MNQDLTEVSPQFPRHKANRVLMIIENCPFRQDPRVRREARTLVKAGYRVSVISPRWTRQAWRQLVDGVKVYQFPAAHVGDAALEYILEYALAMLAIALLTAVVCFVGDGFDIIQIANPPDCIILIVALYKLFGKLVIYDQHDLCPELYEMRFGEKNRTVSGTLYFLERLSYKLADHVIVTNESYKQIALRRGGLSPPDVTVVRNGPDLKDLAMTGADPELRKKAPNIIVYAGITGSQDGVDFLCRSLYSLRYKLNRSDFYCVVLGDGSALPAVKSLAHTLGLDDFIWFAGWIDDPELYARYLATADICVAPEPSNPYNDRSTFVKVMEYMSAGKPVVAFDLPETRNSAGQGALYAAANDETDFAVQITKLMDSPGLARITGEIGRERIRTKLAWEYSAPNLLGVYKKFGHPDSSSSDFSNMVNTATPTSGR